MALSQRLDLRQTQAVVMTPQLQQAIKLLQLSNLELTAYVEVELEQNPLLERDERESTDAAPAAEAAPAETVTPAQEINGEAADLWQSEAGPDGAGDQDFGGDPDAWRSRSGNGGGEGGDLSGIDQAAARELSLREHLLGQVSIDLGDPVDRMIATHLVELVDEAGYI